MYLEMKKKKKKPKKYEKNWCLKITQRVFNNKGRRNKTGWLKKKGKTRAAERWRKDEQRKTPE